MLGRDHLLLKLLRLKTRDKWTTAGEGLVFLFPHGGSGHFSAGGAGRELHSGDALVAASAAGAELVANGAGEIVFWTFLVRVEHLYPLFSGHELSLLQAVVDELKAVRHYEAASAVAKECHRLLDEMPAPFSLDHRGQLLRVAATVLSAEFKRERVARSGFVGVEEHLSQVFERLTFDEILDLSVDQLAGKFGCSRRHLNRLFHQHLGLSVATLRMEMRLLKAISLLRDPGAKIIQVAEQCGFNHLGLFNTCFKRRFGCSPGQWRRVESESQIKHFGSNGDATVCRLQRLGLCPFSAEGAAPTPPPAPRFQREARELEPIEVGRSARNRRIRPAPITAGQGSRSKRLSQSRSI